MTADARLVRWLTDDMRALATLVDEATITALADAEVRSARQHLIESLEAAERATHADRTSSDDHDQPAHQDQ